MTAVIVTGGKQYRVAEGDVIYIEKLPAEAEETVTFDQVLAVTGEGVQSIGKPLVEEMCIRDRVYTGTLTDEDIFTEVTI